MDLKDISAVVTGGSGGLGLATAGAFARAGAHVVAADLPSSAGRLAVDRLAPGVTFVAADVTAEDEMEAVLDAAERRGVLRVVVNCAGVVTPGRIVGRDGPMPLEQFGHVLRINLVGTFNVLRLAAVRMSRSACIDGERGVIINTASVAAYEGQTGQAAYAASKGGVVSLTLPAARELASSLIRVVAIAPGLFGTPMIAGLPQITRDSLAAQVPHPQRLGHPREFAALAQHIVENPMINGEVIRLDGAIRMSAR